MNAANAGAIVAAGYPYEFVGLLYYVFFLLMNRRRSGAVYSRRSKALTLLTAAAMVGCVPFRYATSAAAVTAMFVLALLAMISTLRDAMNVRRNR